MGGLKEAYSPNVVSKDFMVPGHVQKHKRILARKQDYFKRAPCAREAKNEYREAPSGPSNGFGGVGFLDFCINF